MNVGATRDLSRIKPSDLPSPSQSCLRVVKEASNPDASVEHIGRSIGADPAFTAEILRTVNSPFYSVRTTVTTIPRAITVLGWRNLRNLALTFAVREAMKSSPIKGPLFQQFWEHAMRRAVACKKLAKMTGKADAEEAFTIGLLQDFGTLALFKVCPDLITEWDTLMSGLPVDRSARERELFGTTHDEIARLLAARWGLPDGIALPISFHHSPDDPACPANLRPMALIAGTADIANAVYVAENKMGAIEALGNSLFEHHGLPRDSVEAFLGGVSEDTEASAGALGVRMARPPSYEDLLHEANRTLMAIKSQEEERSANLERMVREKEQLAEELERARSQLERLAFLDPLTGLANRRRFEEVFLNEISRASRERRPLSLVMLDIDHFKNVNDTFGHPFGDAVIQAVGLAMARGTRTYDFHARIGGEEMVMVLAGVDAAGASAIAERVRNEVESLRLTCAGRPLTVTASFGGVTFDPRMGDVGDRVRLGAQMAQAADNALYAAKQGGRNRVCWSTLTSEGGLAVAS